MLAAHSAILLFWLQSSHLSKDRLAVLTGRTLLTYAKERDTHLRKSEGSMLTEGKKKSLTSLSKISESSALLCYTALYSDPFMKSP